MPIYMDVHIVPGVKAKDVAEAHRKDLLHQHEYGCNCMTYWIDEERETIFCLIDAADKDAVKEMHNKAHGMVPNKIIEVSSSIVESFLGRIYDPEEARATPDGLKVFSDPSFRILLVTTITDPLWRSTSFSYTDAFSDGVNRNTFAYPTTVTDADGFQARPIAGWITVQLPTTGASNCLLTRRPIAGYPSTSLTGRELAARRLSEVEAKPIRDQN